MQITNGRNDCRQKATLLNLLESAALCRAAATIKGKICSDGNYLRPTKIGFLLFSGNGVCRPTWENRATPKAFGADRFSADDSYE
jgi:hypothetical protein